MLAMCAATMLGNSEGFRLSGKSLGKQYGCLKNLQTSQKKKKVHRSLRHTFFFCLRGGSEGEEQGEGKHHDDSHDELQGKPHLHIVHEAVLPGMHDQGVGRGGKRGGETHAGRHGDGKEEGHGADADLLCALQGDGSQQDGGGRVADEQCHQRGGEVDAGHEGNGAELPQPAHEAVGDELRGSGLFQCQRHGKHGGDEHDAFPVDGLVGRLHVAEATGQHHEQPGDEHRRHGSHGDEVEHHHGHHEHHDGRGQRGLVVKSDLGGLFEGLSQHHPVLVFPAQPGDVGPRALHQQHVAREDARVAQPLEQVVFLPPDAQHVHVELVSQPGLLDGAVDDARSGHEHDFGDADVVEVQGLAGIPGFLRGVPVHELQPAVLGPRPDLFHGAFHVEQVVCVQGQVWLGQFLGHGFQETVLFPALAAHFQNVQPVFPADVEFLDGASVHCGPGGHPEAEQVVVQPVFPRQVLEGLSGVCLGVFAGLPGQEGLAQRQQHGDADGHAEQPHGEEGEERQGGITRLGQRFLDDEVGRRADERHHAAHAAGKGQGHEQAAGMGAGVGGHADHDGEHQGHRARVADKGADGGRDGHHEDEQPQFAFAGQFQDARADHLGQSRLEDGPAHDEKSHHHDDHRIGEARQGLFGGEDMENEEGGQCAQGHKVRTEFPAGKAYRGKDEYGQGNPHGLNRRVMGLKSDCFSAKLRRICGITAKFRRINAIGIEI